MENDILNKQIVEMHLPCPSCGSHDALTTYADGHSYCFSCKATTFPKEDKEGGTVTSAPAFKTKHLKLLVVLQAHSMGNSYSLKGNV